MVVRGWTREAGVRELDRRVGQVARKLARRALAEDGPRSVDTPDAAAAPTRRRARRGPAAAPPAAPIDTPTDTPTEAPTVVRAAELPELLGPAPFEYDEAGLEDKIGVANGLAYTAAGGEMLEVEVSVVPGRGRVQLTGTLGDVMKESAGAAVSWVRARARALGVDPEFYRASDVHVHLPAGATPKDGPSAGVTIAAALVSALTGVPLRGDVAMTGEITLRGRVLPVGGLKEKAVAAHRQGVAHVIVPYGNARAVDELPAEVRAGLAWHPARTMDEVLALALRREPAAVEVAPDAVPAVPVPPVPVPAVPVPTSRRAPVRRPKAARERGVA
jgi:ATP-dependent Lon protease